MSRIAEFAILPCASQPDYAKPMNYSDMAVSAQMTICWICEPKRLTHFPLTGCLARPVMGLSRYDITLISSQTIRHFNRIVANDPFSQIPIFTRTLSLSAACGGWKEICNLLRCLTGTPQQNFLGQKNKNGRLFCGRFSRILFIWWGLIHYLHSLRWMNPHNYSPSSVPKSFSLSTP